MRLDVSTFRVVYRAPASCLFWGWERVRVGSSHVTTRFAGRMQRYETQELLRKFTKKGRNNFKQEIIVSIIFSVSNCRRFSGIPPICIPKTKMFPRKSAPCCKTQNTPATQYHAGATRLWLASPGRHPVPCHR